MLFRSGGPWNDDGIKAINKWLDRAERYVIAAYGDYVSSDDFGADEKELNRVRHNTIKATDSDYNEFGFNTAVARMMELVNALSKYDQKTVKNSKLYRDTADDFLKVICPLAPHFAEELWHQTGHKGSIIVEPYPVYDERALKTSEIELLVQFNSRPKTRITVDTSLTVPEIEKFVLADVKVKDLLGNAAVKKVIVIPNRLINLIVG